MEKPIKGGEMFVKRCTLVGLVLILALGVVLAGCAKPAPAPAPAPEPAPAPAPKPAGPTPAEFYKGKNIEYIVPAAPGGSQDLFGRIFAVYLKQYTGAGAVIVKNVTIGGVMGGTNEQYAAEADGLHLGNGPFVAMLLNQVMQAEGLKYDMEKFSWIGGTYAEPAVFCVPAGGKYQTIADLKAGKGIKFGSTTVVGTYTLGLVTICSILDLDAKVVTGYAGTSEIELAAKKGEVSGEVYTAGEAILRVKQGGAKALCMIASKRFVGMPDVPTLGELVPLNEQQKDLIRIWDDLISAKAVYGSPGIPSDRLAFLREVWTKTLANPEAMGEFEKLGGYKPLASLSFSELENMTKALIKRKAEIKAKFDDLVKRYRSTL